MLQYDDSAFHYFALSTIALYLIPSWYTILSKCYQAFIGLTDSDIGAEVRTTAEAEKAKEIKKKFKGVGTLSSKGFVTNLIITLIFTAVFLYLIISVSEDGEVNSFDPFKILGVDTSTELKKVKKAFREKSLKWHPDKNPNNPAAEAMFMMINKAYEALTDPVSKENFEKYGNPDGKQSLEVSIGLPSFLLDSQNRNLVLMVYLLTMVVGIPFAVWRYYSDSSKFGEKDVMYDTYSWFHHTLNEHTTIKSLPEVFAGSAEFRSQNMPETSSEKEEIASLMSKVRSQMQKPKYNHPVCVKGNVLLHGHLLRQTDTISDKATTDLDTMLRQSNSLIEAMITVCKHQDWLQTALNCITFGQHVAQACWLRDSTLLQLPHFTDVEVKHCEKGKNQAKNILQYIKLEDGNKKGLANFTDEQRNDVLETCKLIPDVTISTKTYVDDDEDSDIYEDDLATVSVTITKNNFDKVDKTNLVHAPRFPYPKAESWWIVLGATKQNKIISAEKVTSNEHVIEHNIKFLAPGEGQYEFDLFVKSNGYLGIDQKMKVTLDVKDNSTLPEYKIHPDDELLDDEPTLFEEMMNSNVEEDSGSDDDDSDEDSEDDKTAIKELTKEERKKMELKEKRKKAAGTADDDSDSDSDVEEVFAEK